MCLVSVPVSTPNASLSNSGVGTALGPVAIQMLNWWCFAID